MGLQEALAERLGDDAAKASRQIELWSTDDRFSGWHGLLEAMVTQERWDELADAFSQMLPFGTGGRRGSVGVGPNRFNTFTLGTSVEGHVSFLKARFTGPLTVVITYDVRSFHDVRQRYPKVPSPLDGTSSRSLAELAARIYAAHGVTAWIQRRDDPTYLSTPELSFLIRELNAHGGLNVSASHNPPDDNGGKFYDQHGGQLVPPLDQELLDRVADLTEYRAVSWEEAADSLCWLDDEHHQAYVEVVARTAPACEPIPVAYTSLHGVGRIHEILSAAGFPTTTISEQSVPDGAFPTVPGAVANPERPEVFALGLEHLTDEKLLFATDPDADRIGVMVRTDDGWSFLSGNQLAAIVVDVVLRRWTGSQRPLVVHTEVSSSFLSRVAMHHGADVRNDLLVGFKYIADVMNHAESGQFAVGAEESHGLLVGERMRDKCSGSGALWLAVAASDAATEGKTLVDRLDELEALLGAVRNAQVTKRFEGVSGRADMATLLDGLRAKPPVEFAGRRVIEFVDHRDPAGRYGPIRSATDAASRNVLVAQLEGGRVIFRPSGTEPKLKVYVEASGSSSDEADHALVDLTDATRRFLGIGPK